MTRAPVDLTTIDLDNCDREPIHVPGFIQPHGALVAMDFEGRLTHVSANAASILIELPVLGSVWTVPAAAVDATLSDAIATTLSDARTGQECSPLNVEVTMPSGEVFDAVVHVHDRKIIVELERRAPGGADLASFALLAHRSMGHLRTQKDIAALLKEAVSTVRQLTGFDRVMAYRFHQDDSGEVVAEELNPELEPFLHRRFPASDIPVQARALYVLNPLRLIADVDDIQIRIEEATGTDRPLDLSHSVLRSVSPIHIEYLRNIHVSASMSLSIVVHGRLWGLIACHHGDAHRVAYPVRMTCDVLSHVLSSSIQSRVERLMSQRRAEALTVRNELTDLLRETDTFATKFQERVDSLGKVIAFDAVLCVYAGDRSSSTLGMEADTVLLRWLDAGQDDLVAIHQSALLPQTVRLAMGSFCGLLAICIDRVNRGWLVFLRREQVETIVWSGIPAKLARLGPLGARLTPHGSLAEWRQTVEGTSVAWDDTDLSIARDLMDSLARAGAANAARMEMARAQLLAVLGHDLRDPLQTIGMMGRLLEQAGIERHTVYGRRIAVSIGRMQRLIGEVFEMSRMRAGLGLGLAVRSGELAIFVQALVDDAQLAHPESEVVAEIPSTLDADFDPDRMAQVVNNLLSNARNHGLIGEAVWLKLAVDCSSVLLSVSNTAPPIEADDVGNLFDPFKSKSVGKVRNPGGLGLGLYIASEVVKGHGGKLEYSHDGTRVSFNVTFPRYLPNEWEEANTVREKHSNS